MEAGLALKPELLREEANKRSSPPPLTVTVPDLVKECRKWRSCQTFFFSALYQLNKELCRLLARVNTLTDSQPNATSGLKLNGHYELLIPLSLNPRGSWDMVGDCAVLAIVCSFLKVTVDDRDDWY